MKSRFIFLLFLFATFAIGMCQGQNSFKLSGQVLDENGKCMPLVNVSIHLEKPQSNQPTIISPTLNYGRFSFILNQKGRYILEARFVGYKTYRKKIKITKNTYETIRLYPTFETLDEIVIQTTKKRKEFKEKKDSTPALNVKSAKNQLLDILNFVPGLSWFGTGFALSPNVLEGETLNRMVVVENDIQQIPIHWGLDRGREFDLFGIEGVEHMVGPNGYQYGSNSGVSLIRLKQQILPPPLSLFGNIMIAARNDNRTHGMSVLSSARTKDFYMKGRASMNLNADVKTKAKQLQYGDQTVGVSDTFSNTAKTDWSMMLLSGLTKEWGKSEFTIKNTFRQQGFFPLTYHATPSSFMAGKEDIRNVEIPYYNALNLHLINNNKFYTKNGSIMLDFGYQYNEYQNWSNEEWFTNPESVTFDLKQEDLEIQDKIQNISGNLRIEKLHGRRNAYKIGISGYHLSNEIDGFSYLLPAFTQQNFGAFFREQVYLSNDFHIAIGARYDFWRLKTEENFKTFVTTHPHSGLNTKTTESVVESKKFNGLSYSISSLYSPNNFIDLTFLFGKNLRMPTISEFHSNGYNARTYRYEIGNAESNIEKSHFLSFMLDYNKYPFEATIFSKYSHFYNYLYPLFSETLYVSPNNTTLPVINYCEAKANKYSIVADVSAYLLPNVLMKVTGDFTYANIIKGDSTIPFPMIQLPKLFYELSYLPQQNFSIFEDLELGLQVEKGFDQNRVSEFESETAGYTTMNFSFGSYLNFGHDRIRLDIQWRNMLNKEYFDPTKFYRVIGIPEPSNVLYFTINIPFQGLGKH